MKIVCCSRFYRFSFYGRCDAVFSLSRTRLSKMLATQTTCAPCVHLKRHEIAATQHSVFATIVDDVATSSILEISRTSSAFQKRRTRWYSRCSPKSTITCKTWHRNPNKKWQLLLLLLCIGSNWIKLDVAMWMDDVTTGGCRSRCKTRNKKLKINFRQSHCTVHTTERGAQQIRKKRRIIESQ